MISKRRIAVAALSGTAAICAITNPGALAQTQGQTQSAALATDPVEEIIVTAEKHATSVEKTPLSIAAITGQDLLDRGINSLAELAQGVPGVSLKSEGPSQTEIEMRGMTSSGGNSATVGFYLDDVPLTGPAGAQNGHVVIDPDLYDLNRVEMLRGPQGTLFGSGSMGGTVRLITNQPSLTGFDATAESMVSGTDGGDGVNHKFNAMVNVPLADTLAVRVVGTESYTSGWIDRIVIAPGDFPQATPIGKVEGVDGITRGDVPRECPLFCACVAQTETGDSAGLRRNARDSAASRCRGNGVVQHEHLHKLCSSLQSCSLTPVGSLGGKAFRPRSREAISFSVNVTG